MQTPRPRHSETPSDGAAPGGWLEGSAKHWPRNLLVICLFVEAWLIFLHLRLALHAVPSVRVLGQAFDVTRESSIGTYWSCLLTLGIGLAAFFIAYLLRLQEAPKLRRWAWMLLGVVFLVFSVDDAIAFHEKLGSITSLGLMRSLSYPSYPWHITVAPFLGGALLLAVFFIWRDIRKIKGLSAMLLLALGCFAVAFGLDFAEGIKEMAAMASTEAVAGSEHLPFLMLIEEVLEVAGTTIFLYVVFTYLLSQIPDLKSRWKPSAEHRRDGLSGSSAGEESPALQRSAGTPETT